MAFCGLIKISIKFIYHKNSKIFESLSFNSKFACFCLFKFINVTKSIKEISKYKNYKISGAR